MYCRGFKRLQQRRLLRAEIRSAGTTRGKPQTHHLSFSIPTAPLSRPSVNNSILNTVSRNVLSFSLFFLSSISPSKLNNYVYIGHYHSPTSIFPLGSTLFRQASPAPSQIQTHISTHHRAGQPNPGLLISVVIFSPS